MTSRDDTHLTELRASADELGLTDMNVQRFVAQAFDEVHRLTVRIEALETEVTDLRNRLFLDGDHRQRLEEMVGAQTDLLHEEQARVQRVRALVDLARWSAQDVGGSASTIRVDDVERALGRQP